MSTQALPRLLGDADLRHRMRWWASALAAAALIVALLLDGYSYYTLPLAERVREATHARFRPSGTLGLKLGVISAILFLCIYLYPIRKRWAWLRSIGNTRNWLDFHILMGVVAPVLVTLHSSFRFHGLAGIAFWIMWTVTLSGFVGRYFYGQIPRHVTAAEMNLEEIERTSEEVKARLREQQLFTEKELETVLQMPDREAIGSMSLFSALWTMFTLDMRRPWRVSRLRRRSMSVAQRVLSLGGLLRLGGHDLEQVISLVRKQAWISTKVQFLGRTQQVFHLWHVVHRPFSYSFAVLVLIHIGFVIALGYL